jgi:GNAT superfamily N-acetyltransferase
MSDRTDLTIRPAQATDARAIADVLRDVGWFEHIKTELSEATEQRVAEQLALCATDQSHTVLVAQEADGQVAGYVAVHWFPNLMNGGDGYISELFLRGAARGQGIGGELLAAVEQVARRRGFKRLMLFNRKERVSYQRTFYPKHGWEERVDVAFFTRTIDDD